MGRRQQVLTGVLAALAAACVALVLLSGYGRWAAGPGGAFGPEGEAPARSPEPVGPHLLCVLESLTQQGEWIDAQARVVPAGGLGAVTVDQQELEMGLLWCRLWVPGRCPVKLRQRMSIVPSFAVRPVLIPLEGLEISLHVPGEWRTPVCEGVFGGAIPPRCELDYDLDTRSDWIGADDKVVLGGKVWGVGRAEYRRESRRPPGPAP